MCFKLINNFKYLPNEVIHKIINYTDVIIYRHGKYINRLTKSDERYTILKTIPRPIKIGLNNVLLKLLNMKSSFKSGYFLEYKLHDFSNIKLVIKFINYNIDGFDKYIEVMSFSEYIFDESCKWVNLKFDK